jgi:hypothetical protein
MCHRGKPSHQDPWGIQVVFDCGVGECAFERLHQHARPQGRQPPEPQLRSTRADWPSPGASFSCRCLLRIFHRLFSINSLGNCLTPSLFCCTRRPSSHLWRERRGIFAPHPSNIIQGQWKSLQEKCGDPCTRVN